MLIDVGQFEFANQVGLLAALSGRFVELCLNLNADAAQECGNQQQDLHCGLYCCVHNIELLYLRLIWFGVGWKSRLPFQIEIEFGSSYATRIVVYQPSFLLL